MKKNKFILSLLAVVIAMGAMRYFDSFLITENCKGIVSFELAKDLERSKIIINSWNTEAKTAAGLSLGFDFLFILIYIYFLSLLVKKLTNNFKNHGLHIKPENLFVYLLVLVGVFDIIENIALIKLLLGDFKQIYSSVSYYFASLKFGLLALIIAYIMLGNLYLSVKK